MIESWELVKLGDLAEINPHSLREDTDDTYSFKYIDLSLVKEGVINYPEREILFGEASPRARRIVQKSDILLSTVRPNLRGYGIIENSIEDHICSTGFAVVRCASEITAKYIYQYLFCESFERQIHALVVGSNYPAINTNDVASLKFLLPPLAEQERIVEILSDADAAITIAETSFATRHKRLRGLIQSLIGAHQTSSKWDVIALDDIGRVSSAGVDKKSVDGETQVTLLNYMDVYRLERIASKDLYHQVTAPISKVSSCNIEKGDIFFTPTSEKRDDIAHSAVAWEDIQGAVYSYHVVRLRPSISLDINFSSYAFQTDHFMRQAYRLADGSGQRYVISLGGFRNMTIALPPIEQQRAIGACLAEARLELDKLSMEICALKKQKRGLMQQLLTGKLRVPEKVQ